MVSAIDQSWMLSAQYLHKPHPEASISRLLKDFGNPPSQVASSACMYDELYTSDTWNQAHDKIMKQRRGDDCELERVVAGLMFWSDSTQLAQFGHVSAWPIYLFFGNLSKYA